MNNVFKKSIFTLIFLLSILNSFAQSEKKREVEFLVAGNCNMCKTRIESAMDVKGVYFSEWNSQTRIMKVIYNPQKIEEQKLYQICAEAGHDTEKVKAENSVYDKLHACCKYERLP